jgi:predicted RNA-binding protein Jag
MELCTNAGIISDALKFVEKRRDTLQKLDERIEDTAAAEGQEVF